MRPVRRRRIAFSSDQIFVAYDQSRFFAAVGERFMFHAPCVASSDASSGFFLRSVAGRRCALLGAAFLALTAGVAGADPAGQGAMSLPMPGAAAPERLSLEALGVCDRTIYLATGPVRAEGERVSLAKVAGDPVAAAAPRVIQLDGPMTPTRRAALEGAGVRLGAYIPSNAYIARLNDADAAALEAIDFIRWHESYQDAWKLSANIGQAELQTAERRAIADRGQVVVAAALFPGEDAADTVRRARAIEGAAVMQSERSGDLDVISLALPLDRLAELAAIESVQFVQEYPEATLRNSSARWIVQSNIPFSTPIYDRGLAGSGQIVGVIDNPIRVDHCSFQDSFPIGPNHRKILAYNATLSSSLHGTHVAATAVGDAFVNNDTRGVAYDARLVYSPIPSFTTGSFNSALELHHSQGARVHTNSWGSDLSTEYNIWTRDIDVFTHAHEDDLVLVAITNQSTLRTPENAKNAFAIAASLNHPQQSKHGSGGAGPTNDGRMKPELCAPGVLISSASPLTSCGVIEMAGTSMAAPTVAGAALIARQYFTEGRYPDGLPNVARAFTPTAALLRAVLINSGDEMESFSGYPNSREGWGRLLLDRSLAFPDDPRQLLLWDVRRSDPGSLVTGAVREHEFQVLGDEEPVRITLVFTDAPAALGAEVASVNNVDLKVTDPDGAVYRGNAFAGDGFSLEGGRYMPAMGLDFDPKNTVEQVHVASPQVGRWSIEVIGSAVNQGEGQGYALVVTGAVGDVGACPADLNGDGQVNAQDLALLLSAWEAYKSFPAADLNGDGDVNAQDLALFFSYWGGCP
ncbi:MAG: hypothetical protein EA376_05405 [Phycisphaeraceae bacterium]|nr:MAG: hypothetical protein EA376_05405 [Phycisphaeraceae bacterium]